MNPLLLFAFGALFVASGSKKRGKANAPSTPPAECEGVVGIGGGELRGVDFIEFVAGGGNEGDRLPMIISLHGLGYDKNAHAKWLDSIDRPVRIILPNAFYESEGPNKRAWWPSYSDSNLKEASKRLAGFVYMVQQCYPTKGKPILTGHSQGGYVAIDFATQFPELISASVPVAATRAKRLWDIEPQVPVHAIHATGDNSYEHASSYYYNLHERGLPTSLTVIDGAPHRLVEETAYAWRGVLSSLLG